jgi:hypothetical protein
VPYISLAEIKIYAACLQVFFVIRFFTIIESHSMEACDLGSDSKQVESYLKPVHIVNELVTPEVHYDSWKEFVELVYLVQDAFCHLLAEAVQQEIQTEHLSPVLGSIYCRIPTLAQLKATAPNVIM